jgi:biopolymer transport protein ExbD
MHRARRRTAEVEVNLTPLIDVVFLLLIFFMISTQFKAAAELGLDLPTASAAQSTGDTQSVLVTVTRTGQYAVDQVGLPASTEASLMAALQRSADVETRGVRLEADADASHQSVVTVLSVLSKLNVEQVAIVALPESDPNDDE